MIILTVNGAPRVRLRLSNRGFGKAFNPRGCDLLLRPRGGGAVVRLAIATDARRWLPDDDTITVPVNVTVPSSTPPGVYDILWHLPDTATNAASGQRELAGRPEYSIRIASAGVWEPSTGYNNLGLSVRVTPATGAVSLCLPRTGRAVTGATDRFDIRGRCVSPAVPAGGLMMVRQPAGRYAAVLAQKR